MRAGALVWLEVREPPDRELERLPEPPEPAPPEPAPALVLVPALDVAASLVTTGALGVAAVEPVEVLVVCIGAVFSRLLRRDVPFRGVARSLTVGASPRPAEIGSEESPMCWLVSWLVAQVIPAVITIPSSAASPQRAV